MDRSATTPELRILMLEDMQTDAELAEHELRKSGLNFILKRVERRDTFLQAIEEFRPDIILSDFNLPDLDGMSALQLVQRNHPEIPVIMVTGARSDIEAVDLLQAGAKDYVLKDRLARLGPAVLRVLSTEQGNRARIHAELALQRTNRLLHTLSEVNRSLVYSGDELQLLHAICRAAVEKGGYRMAWVGYLEQDADRSIRPIAQEGFDEGYLEQAHITWADTERGQGPTGRAARTCQIQFVKDIAHDPGMSPWQMDATKRGYASSIALPLLENNRCFGVLTIYAAESDAFDADELNLLEEMAGDLAFGILTIRVKAAQGEQELRLLNSMLQTVKAIAGIIEMRDPYTSGHQSRVAELARSIAIQMGLPEDTIQAIHLAGLVHDLGKISIPAEILSKPGKLNDIEFNLIKIHPQSGYEILKDIDFSWPIAQMVLQHHERLDGSGYPQGLKGDQILLGARILTVADVVEAMSSHRPYRPGLGIDAALEEITRNANRHYDSSVVEACVKLFRERGYVISN